MNPNIEVIFTSVLFCVFDIFVLMHANREKLHTDKQKTFTIFAVVVLLQQIGSTIVTIQQREVLHVNSIVMWLACIMMFCCMTASSQSIIRYTATLEHDGDQASTFFKFCNAVPLTLMIFTCFLSPITHWIFYIDDNGIYQRGSLFVLQLLLPYSYFFIEMAYIASMKIKGKPVTYLVKQFIGFFLPSLIGVIVQMMGFVGGYSAVGISFGMILLYLDLYVDEMNDAKRFRETEALNVKLQQSNKELSRSTAINNFFIDPYSLACYYNMQNNEVLLLHTNRDEYISEIGKIDTLSNGLLRYIQNEVEDEDQEMMRAMFDTSYIREHLKNNNSYSFNFKNVSKDFSGIYTCDIVRGEDDDHIAFGFKDVTKELEEQVRQQEELQEALSMAQISNKSKSAFLFNMSHDIRTPMNAIIGFTNMAIKHINDKDKVLDCLNKTNSSGDLLLQLINNILDMSRIESGKMPLEEIESDVTLSFVTMQSTLQELAKTKDIDLTFDFKNIEDRFIYADISRCTRILVNIITNAIKYTNENGKVEVTCEQVGRDDDNAIIQYKVKDNGMGISDEFLEHLFDPFSRESTETVSGIQGTGLGLAVCKTFVESMNGTISCNSKKGVGSTFIVTIPFRIQEGSKHIDPTSKRLVGENDNSIPDEFKNFEGLKVLLVEDNELNMEIAIDILSEEGFVVESAEDGSIAVDILKEKGPEYYNLILMDIQMPKMDGYEATKAIRQMYPKSKLPIIALSANAFAEDKKASLEAGMDGHVAKPINVFELKTVINEFV